MKNIGILLTISTLFLMACESTKVPVPEFDCEVERTYLADVELIIQTNCAYSGCHVQGTPGISDYSNYNNLVGAIESGIFENRVLETRTMPPANAPGPDELTDDEIEILNCWIEQGYPE